MKKIILLLMFPLCAFSQKPMKYYVDGVVYKSIDTLGVRVTLSMNIVKNHGHYYSYNIQVRNKSNRTIDFNPDSITACYTSDKKMRNVSMVSYDDLVDKIQGDNSFQKFLMAACYMVDVAASSLNPSPTAQYRDNNGNVANIYDHSEQDRKIDRMGHSMSNVSQANDNGVQSVRMGYLKRNTLFPGYVVSGCLYSKFKECDDVKLYIPIDGLKYCFDFHLVVKILSDPSGNYPWNYREKIE
jgi:hypothetical protein